MVKNHVNDMLWRILPMGFLCFLAITGCVLDRSRQASRTSSVKTLVKASKEDMVKKYMEDAQHAICERNYGIAMSCYREAADIGYALARYKLGLAYLDGVMIEKNVDKGLACVRAAAAMGCVQASDFLKERRRRVAKLLDANTKIEEWYGISVGQVVRKQDAVRWDVRAGDYEKYVAEGRWITILPPKHPQVPNTKVHIHLDVKTRCINGIRAYVPVKVNGKGRDVLAAVSDHLLEPFEQIAGCPGVYSESGDNVVTKGLELVDSANENWLKISYTTRYFGAHLELESYGTCFSEFSENK